MTDDFVIFAIESHVGRNINGDNTAGFEMFERGAQKTEIIIKVLNDIHKKNKVVGFEQCRISIKNVINKDTSFAACRHLQGTPIKIASVYREPQVTLDQLTDNPVTTPDLERFFDGMPYSGLLTNQHFMPPLHPEVISGGVFEPFVCH